MAVISKLMSLPVELHLEVEDMLDMAALLALGGTCSYFRDRVSGTLTKERNDIICRYWPDAEDLLRILTWSCAVISGEAALAFILRDPRMLTDELELCVSSKHGPDLLAHFDMNPLITPACNTPRWPSKVHRTSTPYLYRSPSNAPIRVMLSNTPSPFTPITSSVTTALFNYMDEFSFGCAYRDLTMNRRAVVPTLPELEGHVQERLDRIAVRGDFQMSPWPATVAVPPVPFTLIDLLAGWGLPHAAQWGNFACLRRSYQCPSQSRFFGDPGSLVEFFAPDKLDHAVMGHWHFPPYGPTAVWRMYGTRCDERCHSGDHRLRDVQAMVALLEAPRHYGPFTSSVVTRVKVGDTEIRRMRGLLPAAIKIE